MTASSSLPIQYPNQQNSNDGTTNPNPNENWSLAQWLKHCEQLHPHAIDMGLERTRQVAHVMQLEFQCPVITVAGTNGKGSTCAMLESILHQAGYKTGLFSSPHLVYFQERLRLQQKNATDTVLLSGFLAVEHARQNTGVSLTYFEFTTLAILHCMASSGLDVAILEVGLGGRLDAVNVIDADCAILTSIDIDHTEFLGGTRETIGLEKAGIMRKHKPAVVSDPMPPASVLEYAKQLDVDLWTVGNDFNVAGDPQQWSWSGRGRRYNSLAYPALRGANQLLNAGGVLAALTALRSKLPISAQAVRNGLAFVELAGRFQIIPGGSTSVTIILDVAHNPHAVATLALNLDAMGFSNCTHAVFGAMADKDSLQMLQRMLPLVDCWYFTDLASPRAASAVQLQAHYSSLIQSVDKKAPNSTSTIQTFSTPILAFDAAKKAAKSTDRIVVFGSFLTVGAVLQII